MSKSVARSVADVSAGVIVASVDIAVPRERVFRALTESSELVRWWGDDAVYRTTSWVNDVRKGGAWRAEGVGADGTPFHVEGEYLEVDAPRKLVLTWNPVWDPGPATTITYLLEETAKGTRVVVRHEGFGGRAESCTGHANGWERVLGWLARDLSPAKFFVVRLIPPRPTFLRDMTPEEGKMMKEHAAYWSAQLGEGNVVVFGPVADPAGPWGLGVVRAADEAAVRAFEKGDPVIQSGGGFRYEVLPMVTAVY